MKKLINAGLALAMLLLFAQNIRAQAVNYKAQSVFLYNFARYTEWPAAAANEDVVRFGIIGKTQVFDELSESMQNKQIQGKKIVVEQLEELHAGKLYHLLFVADNASNRIEELMAAVGTMPSLVVTERDGLIKKGAMVSFVISDDNRLRFEINDVALIQHQLRMASTLKSLAVVN